MRNITPRCPQLDQFFAELGNFFPVFKRRQE